MSKALLATIRTEADYRAVYADDTAWLPAMYVLCQRHGLETGALRRMTLGTHVAFRSGDRIIKLFCPIWGDDFVSERACLAHIEGLPVPELVATGELEGWSYVVMGVVPGVPALEVWSGLDEVQRHGVIAQLGRMMATLHALPAVPELDGGWDGFIQARVNGALDHHGVGQPWKGWIEDRLRSFAEPDLPLVLLSADITEDHLLLSERAGQWRISGFIDFGDARMGHPYYEFIAPLAFYTFGQPALSRTLVIAYGLELTPALADTLTTYCLLHEFGRLEDFVKRCPVADGPGFERALWGDLG